MSPHRLADKLLEDATGFDFFEAVRLIECWNPDNPRLGTALRAGDDPVRFSQEPELEFPVASLAAYRDRGTSAKPRMVVNFLGMFGPHGALPLHLTEHVRDRLRHHRDPTFVRFADIFQHRMISLFYRAWANAQPVVEYDRPDFDRFAFYVGTTFGIGGTSFRHRDALSDRAKLFYAGHLSLQCKHPEGLRAIIEDILKLHANIVEFVGEWMDIQASDQTRLGWSEDVASLGQSTTLGASVWGCQHKFRIVLGPLTQTQYCDLLPGGLCLPILIAIVRNYLGNEYVWDVQLILKKEEVPDELTLGRPAKLFEKSLNGDAQLGWSMWLGPRHGEEDAGDLRLNPFINMGEG